MDTINTEKLYGTNSPLVVTVCGLKEVHIQYVNLEEIQRRQALRHFISLVEVDLGDFEECSEEDGALEIPAELVALGDFPASHHIENLVKFDIDQGVKSPKVLEALQDTHFLAYLRDPPGNIQYLGVSSESPEKAVKSLMVAIVSSPPINGYMQDNNTSCVQVALESVLGNHKG